MWSLSWNRLYCARSDQWSWSDYLWNASLTLINGRLHEPEIAPCSQLPPTWFLAGQWCTSWRFLALSEPNCVPQFCRHCHWWGRRNCSLLERGVAGLLPPWHGEGCWPLAALPGPGSLADVDLGREGVAQLGGGGGSANISAVLMVMMNVQMCDP